MLWIPKEKIPILGSYKKELTITPKYDNRSPISTFEDTDDYLGIPRNYLKKLPSGVEDKRVLPDKLNFKFTGKLRKVQEDMVSDWRRLLNSGIDDWVVKGDTGVGKTIIMIKIACELRLPFLVIVPLERLMTYWVDQIKKFTDIEDVGVIQQNRCEFQGAASVGMVHSLCKDRYSDEMKNHFGFIIFDELHSYASDHFSKVVNMFPAKHRCGASATLERADGTEDVYFYNLGRHIISTEQKTQPKPTIYKYCYDKSSGSIPSWVSAFDMIKVRAMILSLLSRNTDRNKMIAYFARTLINKGIQTLVIGDRISQLKEIQDILIREGCLNTGLYIGGTPDSEKRRIEKEADCILATMKMLEVGIDIDTLRGLIFATPKSSVQQVVGRIRRINVTVPDPVVVDIVDVRYKQAISWFNSRARWYGRENFDIKEIAG